MSIEFMREVKFFVFFYLEIQKFLGMYDFL